jgi:hypothetical protein
LHAPATISSRPCPAVRKDGRVRVSGSSRLVPPRSVGIIHGDERDGHEDAGERHARPLRSGLGDLEDLLEEPGHSVGVGCGAGPVARRKLRDEALTERPQGFFLQAELFRERLGEPGPGDRGGHVADPRLLRRHLGFEGRALAVVVRVLVLESLREAVDEAGLDLLRREELPQFVDDGAVQLPLGDDEAVPADRGSLFPW